MANICCGDHHVRDPKGHGLRRQNHVTVQGLVIGCRSPLLTGLGPKYGSLPHRRRGEGQIFQQNGKRVKARQPSHFVGTQ
jgi:hypothetical protein